MSGFLEEILSSEPAEADQKLVIDIPATTDEAVTLVIETSEQGNTVLTDCEEATVAVEELLELAEDVDELEDKPRQLQETLMAEYVSRLIDVEKQLVTVDEVITTEDTETPGIKTRTKELAIKAYRKLKTAVEAILRWIKLFFKQMSHACRNIMKDYDHLITVLDRLGRNDSDVEIPAIHAYDYFYVGRKNDQHYGKDFYLALREFYKSLPEVIKSTAVEIEKAGQAKTDAKHFKQLFPSFYTLVQKFVNAAGGKAVGNEKIVLAPMNKQLILTEEDNAIILGIESDKDATVTTGKVKIPIAAILDNVKIVRDTLSQVVRKEQYISDFERMLEKQLKLLEEMEAENIEAAIKAASNLKVFFTRTIQKIDPYAIRMSHGLLRALQSSLKKDEESKD